MIREQDPLFGSDTEFHREWQAWRGMPEFSSEDLEPFETIRVLFKTRADLEAFWTLVGQRRQERQERYASSIWYPRSAIGGYSDKRYISDPPRGPLYPIYIVSKGRAYRQMTSNVLHRLGVPHYVVVELTQLEDYRATANPSATYLVLDPAFQRDYDQLTDAPGSTGPGPARNFAWAHALASGARRHWVMDDNIRYFTRYNRNLKTPMADGSGFRVMEDWADRWTNVAMAGPNYFMFVARKNGRYTPVMLNTRIYSCNLILNSVPLRWRGRYNEDTILSLDMMAAGWVTAQFNAFLQFKITTQHMKGGNTEEFYAREGTRLKSQMLKDAYPLITEVVERYGRVHHEVDYRVYSGNRLVRDPAVPEPTEEVDNMGLVLERRQADGTWLRMPDGPWYPWEDGR